MKRINLKEDAVTSVELKSSLNITERSLFQISSGVRRFWRSFHDLVENIEGVSSIDDFAEFNPPLGLDDELVIPEIVYRKEEQQRSVRSLKNTKSSEKLTEKTPLAAIRKQGQSGVLQDFNTKGTSAKLQEKLFQQDMSQKREETDPRSVKKLRRQAGEVFDATQVSTESKGEQNVPENKQQETSHKVDRDNQYIAKLCEKDRSPLSSLRQNSTDKLLVSNILTSAFNQTIQGPQTSLALLQPEFAQQSSRLKEFDHPFDAITTVPIKHDLDQPQRQKPMIVDQQDIGNLGLRRPNKRSDTTVPSRGLQLLERLTQNLTSKSNRIVIHEEGSARGVQFPDKAESGSVEAFQTMQKEDLKNVINLTVQVPEGESGEEDLESLGERVNRILVEQARRYGIDVT